MMSKSYSDLIKLKTFEERFLYLMMNGSVGKETFGYDRYLNQTLYKSSEWRKTRRNIIVRDNGCDLGLDDNVIGGIIIIHHMNSITEKDIINRSPKLFDPENLICCSLSTHNAIHFGDESILKSRLLVERKPNDQCPWKN